LNSIHSTGHLTSNLVQNQGVDVLSNTNVFDGRWELPQLINRGFRVILSETQPYFNRYSEFLDAIQEQGDEAIERLLQCDREVVEIFTVDAASDLARARNCISS
jgi:hypothetical protein